VDDDPLEGWETADDLVKRGRALDPTFTRSKLGRLHKKGLLPRPVVRNRIGARGRETFYPPGTGDRLDQVLKVRQSDRRFGEAAWSLWWEGNGVPADARPLLDKTAASLDKTIAKIRGFVDRTASATVEDPALEHAVDGHLRSSPLGWIRRRAPVYSGDSGAYEDLMKVVLRVVRGEQLTEDDARRFEAGIGMDEARTYSFEAGNAWPPEGSMLDSLVWMAKTLATPFSEIYLSDEDLDGARDDAQQLLGLFVDISAPMKSIFGRWGPGFSFIGHGAKWMLSNPGNQAMAVLLFHRLRSEPAFQPGIEHLRPTAEGWRGYRRAWEAMEELQQAFPALGRAVTPKLLASAMQSEDGRRELVRAIAGVRDLQGVEIDEYLADHPDLVARMTSRIGVDAGSESDGGTNGTD
jgi:hypothetical protein